MTDLAMIEERLTAMERAVRDLQQRMAAQHKKTGWLRRFRGAFDDRPEFDEIARLGREFRNSDRPGDDEGPSS